MGRLLAGALGAFALIAGSHAAAQEQRDFASRLLAAHNLERDRTGLPRLAWSNRLAQDAQDWAEQIARRGALQHADGAMRKGEGENLWMGSAGYYSAETMIGGFLAERDMFRPGKFPDVSRTGNWADVGHYTQIVWPATTEVGCAIAKGASEDILVCRYNPAGNVFGQKVG
jgi:hypothetical protein